MIKRTKFLTSALLTSSALAFTVSASSDYSDFDSNSDSDTGFYYRSVYALDKIKPGVFVGAKKESFAGAKVTDRNGHVRTTIPKIDFGDMGGEARVNPGYQGKTYTVDIENPARVIYNEVFVREEDQSDRMHTGLGNVFFGSIDQQTEFMERKKGALVSSYEEMSYLAELYKSAANYFSYQNTWLNYEKELAAAKEDLVNLKMLYTPAKEIELDPLHRTASDALEAFSKELSQRGRNLVIPEKDPKDSLQYQEVTKKDLFLELFEKQKKMKERINNNLVGLTKLEQFQEEETSYCLKLFFSNEPHISDQYWKIYNYLQEKKPAVVEHVAKFLRGEEELEETTDPIVNLEPSGEVVEVDQIVEVDKKVHVKPHDNMNNLPTFADLAQSVERNDLFQRMKKQNQ